jgi:hypothetical protein
MECEDVDWIHPPVWDIYDVHSCTKSLDSSVGIATGYGLDGTGSILSMARFFSYPQNPKSSGAHPATGAMDTWGQFSMDKVVGA